MTKPFSYGELRAGVAAVLRRTAPRHPSRVISVGELRIDLHDRRITLAGKPMAVSATEYRLLCALSTEPTRVFTREELLRTVWGHSAASRTRTLDSHAHRLRAKLAGADQRRERKQIADALQTGPDNTAARVCHDEVTGPRKLSDLEPSSKAAAPAISSPVTGRSPVVGERIGLGSYEAHGEHRLIIGQRVDGIVRVSDIPASGCGRRYLIDR